MSENAGGSAGGGGYRFQASVTALLAVHMLVEHDLTDLINEIQEIPTAVSAETKGPGDDVRIEFSSGKHPFEFQVKHGLRIDNRFDEAFEKIADGLAKNDTIRVVLVVDQTSTKRIQEEFRTDLECFRHGREDSLRDRELFDRVLQIIKKHVTDLGQARELIKRIFVLVMDFDKKITGTLPIAYTLLSGAIPDLKQVRAAWDIERQADLLKRRGNTPTEHPESVTVTFSLCFQNVIQKNSATGDLLRLCAFLSPDLIPEEVILKVAKKSNTLLEKALQDPLEFDALIEALLRYSLVRRKAEGKALSLHRLVQAVLKEEMTPEVQRFWAECAVRAVGAVFPKEIAVNVWGLCLRYLPHAQICMQLIEQFTFVFFEAAQLLHQTGYFLHTQARYGEAEIFLRRALKIERSIVSAEYLLATTEHELARICQSLGKYQEAEKLFQQALHIFEKALGPEHSSTLVTLRNLGALYVDQGKYQEAELLLCEALSQREKTLGANHPSTAAALHQLAVLYQQQGKYQQAEQDLRRTLHIYENTVGLEHPDTAATLYELARLFATQEKYEQAKHLYQQVLNINEKLFGPEHPSMADILQALGTIYMQEEAYEDAEEHLKRSLVLHEKTVGPNHPSYAGALQNLGVLYRKQEAYENAAQVLQQALKIFEEKLGSKHFYTGGTLHALADVCVYQRELDKAEQLYSQAQAIFEQTLEPNHPYIADVRKKLAILRQSR